MNNLTISVCIPAYNCELFIEETLKAILNQTYSNLDIVIVNDGSTDFTFEKINSIVDGRIKVINIKNVGASSARNIAYKNSIGECVVFFDADDLIDKDFLEKQLSVINDRENVVAVSGWGRFYDNNINTFKKEHTPKGEIDFKQWINNYWYNTNPMTTPGRIMIPRSIIEKAGYWDENLTLNDDLDFYTRIFLQTESIVFNPFSFLYYRSGINGLSGDKGYRAYLSLYNSVLNSVRKVLLTYSNDKKIEKSCANMLQSCIYEIYPCESNMIRNLEHEIAILGGASLKPFAGGITKYLNYVLGWKTVRIIKRTLGFAN